MTGLGAQSRSGRADGALFPDLVAKPPVDLYFSREVLPDGRAHHLLRFTSIVWNLGEGRLDLEGRTKPADRTVSDALFQNIYDAETGGRRVERRQIGANLVYHPNHYHYHLDGFAAYLLLRKDAAGDYQPTQLVGGKMSSCVLDTTRVDRSGPEKADYRSCELTRQGLSVGWSDSYHASLPDQWVDLGADPLPDGDYAVRYTVDPADRIAEAGREANNVATAPFSVRGGRITGRPEPARCTLSTAHGPAGTATALTCAHFAPGETVRVYWGGRDPWGVVPSEPIANFGAPREAGADATAAVVFPAAPGGAHNLFVQGASSRRTAVLIVGIEPSLTVASAGEPGQPVEVALRGFGAGEEVALRWEGTPTPPAPARATADEGGSATVRVARPSGDDAHRLVAIGARSGLRAATEVAPPMGNRGDAAPPATVPRGLPNGSATPAPRSGPLRYY